MTYYVGDRPAEAAVIYPSRAGEPIDLTLFDGATVTMTDYDGNTVDVDWPEPELVPGDEGTVVIDWPTDASPFAKAGLFALNVTLTGDTVLERMPPAYVVAETDDGWLTVEVIRQQLGNDFAADDARAWSLLECAKLSILAYGPPLAFLPDGVTRVRPPVNFREGQLEQARNILNSAKTDPAQSDDGSLFVIRPYPLDNFIKQILRPRRGPLGFNV